MSKSLTVLDLFSGIGGFSYAAERLVGGFQTVAFCDSDSACRRVLRKHWPITPIFEDVCTLQAKDIQPLCPDGLSLITAGFPCQDLSVAGKQAGYDGERSVLFYEIIRLARELRPQFLLLENVRNLLSHKNGETFQETLFQIAKAGYDAEWAVIPASDLGACHRRERIWIIAHTQKGRDFGFEEQAGAQLQLECMGEARRLAAASHPDHSGLQGQRPQCELSESSRERQASWRSGGSMLSPEWGGYISKPVLCRGDDGLSGKLDYVRGLIHEGNDQKSLAEAGELGRQALRALWSHFKSATTPHNLRSIGNPDSVPIVSYCGACGRGNVGWWSSEREQVYQGLRNLWADLSGESFKEWQDMLQGLSERARALECNQKMAFKGRTDRLKQLGNSIVPQVAAVPLQRIKELSQHESQ
jgi:site-specific DNA-cytosine methylase